MTNHLPPKASNDFDIGRHTFRPPPFDSLVKQAITFFAATPHHPLPPPNKFAGQGVYGLYYLGDFEPYGEMAARNRQSCDLPIYIGKAVRPGRRKGKAATKSETQDLFKRLKDHTKSITQAENIQLANFRCRFIVLGETEGELIVPIESRLIEVHKPLWNQFIDGFGNHDPGKRRYEGRITEWDVLHPGRKWVERMTGERPIIDAVLAKVKQGIAASLSS